MSYDPFKQPWTIQHDKICSGLHIIAEVSGPRWQEVAAIMAAALELRAVCAEFADIPTTNETPGVARDDDFDALIYQARAAIAKAKGGVQ